MAQGNITFTLGGIICLVSLNKVKIYKCCLIVDVYGYDNVSTES